MIFTSAIFLFVFLPITLFLYYVTPFYKVRLFVLLFMSLFFYSWGEPVLVIVLILSTLLSYICTLLFSKVSKKQRFILLLISIVVVFTPLIFFKYYDFFITNINGLINTNFKTIGWSLPIGISFYTFQLGSYVFDVYVGKIKVQKNFLILHQY